MWGALVWLLGSAHSGAGHPGQVGETLAAQKGAKWMDEERRINTTGQQAPVLPWPTGCVQPWSPMCQALLLSPTFPLRCLNPSRAALSLLACSRMSNEALISTVPSRQHKHCYEYLPTITIKVQVTRAGQCKPSGGCQPGSAHLYPHPGASRAPSWLPAQHTHSIKMFDRSEWHAHKGD